MAYQNVKVLLIEDDEEDYLIIRDLLREIKTTHFELEWEPDAETAIKKIRRQQSDVYLIDHRLGKTTGLEIIAKLKEENLFKPMILLTGNPDHHLDLAAMESGAWDFLSKGRVTSELLDRSIRYSMKRAEDVEKIRTIEKSQLEQKAAEAANLAKSQFLANMSHEIRTPLSAILGYAALGVEPNTSDKERIEYMNVIKKNGEHLLDLINDILDFSKIEAGQMQVHLESCDWKSKIEDVIQLLDPKAKEKGIELSLQYDPQLPAALKTDCRQFRQIMFNIIGNAVKFTEKGKIVVVVESMSADHGPMLKISVSDTGIGMREKEQGKLFQIFSQVNSTRARKFGGTGLGLNISRSLAKTLGGDLVLEKSVPNQGSTFLLTLPLRGVPRSEVQAPKSLERLGLSGKGLNVLLVDDSTDNQELVRRFLIPAQFDIEFANNGREGIEKALRGNFDLVLMDIEMPDMDGFEATSTLRSLGFKKPVIALTAHAFTSVADNARKAGFSGFITKPVSWDTLTNSLIGFIQDYKDQKEYSLDKLSRCK
jgi:signal transduction histidine kinase